MSYFTTSPISHDALYQSVLDPRAGAVLVFDGTARNHSNVAMDVIALEYEAKLPMADKIIAQIIAEVTAQIPIEKVAILHREGRVGLMEPSVVIAVSAAHRGEAYKASRLIIDRIKHEAPIWKKEILPDGSGVWSEGCKACSPY